MKFKTFVCIALFANVVLPFIIPPTKYTASVGWLIALFLFLLLTFNPKAFIEKE